MKFVTYGRKKFYGIVYWLSINNKCQYFPLFRFLSFFLSSSSNICELIQEIYYDKITIVRTIILR